MSLNEQELSDIKFRIFHKKATTEDCEKLMSHIEAKIPLKKSRIEDIIVEAVEQAMDIATGAAAETILEEMKK